MKSIIESKKILICLPNEINLDTYVSAYTICAGLKGDLGKEVDIASPMEISSKFLEVLPMENTKQLTKLPPRKFVIEFKNQKSKVKTIQWNQEGEKLNFFVTMEKGNLNTQEFESSIAGSNYDLIILIGVDNISQLAHIYTENKEIFTESQLVSIGGKLALENVNIAMQVDDKLISISEDTFGFIQKMNLKLEKNKANALLAGLFATTNNFKKNIIDAQTYSIASELIKAGATNEAAQSIVDRTSKSNNQTPTSETIPNFQNTQDRPLIQNPNNQIAQQTSANPNLVQTTNEPRNQ